MKPHRAPRAWLRGAALVVVVLVSGWAFLDPAKPAESLVVTGDEIAHLLVSYALTLAITAAFQGLNPTVAGVLVLALGGSVEVTQELDLIAGNGELADFVADAAGVCLALIPMGLRRR